ncbi:hypothetical protein CPB84DRAFT_1760234 [Gymnopilus junonius]|uniref:Mediator of RNA polymerase II transcription subunit 7 n=1 Tax=Gymnopilus junonius TaxID=109634 RepID=A0A9P5NYP3_GYMJU|nr:hypothetical protein CPB84DRAFT_1760234 [Gymnopilus junonius]
MGSLLSPPPTSPEVPPEWQRHVEWINVLSQNLMAAANDLRPVQARGNLETMMRRQLELRREETSNLHEKCDALSTRLGELRTSVQKMLTGSQLLQDASRTTTTLGQNAVSEVGQSDVLKWAEEV